MKIAILSDIHGNSSALENVLTEIRTLKITKLLILGDFVGYYYHPDKVFELLEGWDYQFIKGNHESMMLEAANCSKTRELVHKQYGSGVNFALERLDPLHIKKLQTAPSIRPIKIMEASILMCHGSPWGEDEYVYPDAPQTVLERCLESSHDYVLLGHTHHPFIFKGTKNILVNPGSVGQSRKRGGKACWAIIDIHSKIVELKETAYDVASLITEAKKQDPHIPYLHEILVR